LATIDGLSGWQVQFYRGNGWSNAQSSGDIVATASAASAPPREQLPAGVRIVLSFDGSQGTLTRDLRLGPQAP
jgi:general secretion pathway protein J